MRGRLLISVPVLVAGLALLASGAAAELVLVENGVSRAPIVLAEDATQDTREAASELAAYIQKISGARPEVLDSAPDPLPARAIWVGYQPVLDELFPVIDFNFEHPEEILFAANESHLVIAGRDRAIGDTQTGHGTENAVCAFLEKKLGVRWLWPKGVGEDIVETDTIALEPFEYRFHPPFRKRHLWPRWMRDWYRHQRIMNYSYPFRAGHAFTDWWDKYHEDHPEYFALYQGERLPPFWGPERHPPGVKLCVSNPEVWGQWMENTAARLEEDPLLMVVSATPNDGPGFCVCERCRAWDHPDAPSGVLTERYVKFWNILARKLRERFPDREVYLGGYAYSAYREPPVAERLEDNIAIGFVGHFPLASDAATAQQKKAWLAWADMATSMVFRPNLFHSSGGHHGYPNVALRRTADAFRFLADNKCVGIEVDTLPNCWSTQGPQYYLMAQMSYDPYLDAEAVMKDYYLRGFGPAADQIERYFKLFEETNDAVLEKMYSATGQRRFDHQEIIFESWSEREMLAEADALMNQAVAKAEEGPEIYRKRVAFVRTGIKFLKHTADIRDAMKRVEQTRYADAKAVRKALDLYEARKALYQKTWETPELRYALRTRWGVDPPEELVNAAQDPNAAQEAARPTQETFVWLAAGEWKPAWSDDFERAELGEDWKPAGGRWSIEDGRLVTQGGKIVSARQFPGLQRVEFRASIEPNPMGVASDMSPIIQSDADGKGYLLQFGGYYNTICSIQKQGKMLAKTDERAIEPGKVHTVVAELDGNTLRLTVDGEVALEHSDPQPLFGPGQDRIGFYVYQGTVRIEDVKVYTAEPVEQADAPQ